MFGRRAKSSEDDQSVELHFNLVNVALAAAVVILVIQAFSFVDLVRQVLLLLVLAILLATGIEPLVRRLRRSGVSRGPSVLGIYLLIVGVIVAFFGVAGRVVFDQASSFGADLPTLSRRLGELAAGLPAGPIRDLGTSAVTSVQPERVAPVLESIFTAGTVTQVLTATLTVFETIFTIVTMFVIAYFWLEERTRIRRLVVRSLKPEHRKRALHVWEDVETRLGAWLRGQLLLMAIIGTAQGIGYAVMGLPFALLLAVFAGLMEAIPMVGPILGAIPALVVALAISPQTALILAGYAILIHLLEGNVLVPRIMESAVGLTPLSIILALLAGAAVGGLMGALIAIPVAAAVQAALVDLIDITGADEPTTETAPIEHKEAREENAA